MSLKSAYSESLQDGKLHFCAHSHHPWLDVTKKAHMDSWEWSAKNLDDKWGMIFSDLLPGLQKEVGKRLGLKETSQITFAPNTHELVFRFLSCFMPFKNFRILTTDSEFYSFDRQINRLSEKCSVEVTKINTEPFLNGSFEGRFLDAAKNLGPFDVVFISHVFFNSGYCINSLHSFLEELGRVTKASIVLDLYHSYSALPLDFSKFENKIFLLGGHYKYGQAGEGSCFLVSPKNFPFDPVHTGWFAEFGELEKSKDQSLVPFSKDSYRFMGSTVDPTPFFRLKAVFDFFNDQNLSVEKSHEVVRSLQHHFLAELKRSKDAKEILSFKIFQDTLKNVGHFLTFDFPKAQELQKKLKNKNCFTDVRGTRIRFGFGIYQDKKDVDQLVSILDEIKIK